VGGNLRDRECNLLRATGFGQDKTVTLMERKPSAHVGQGERRLAVATIGRSDQLKQRLILRDRQELAFAEHPAGRGKVPGEHADFTDVGLCHSALL
jgi:hypothetical protein